MLDYLEGCLANFWGRLRRHCNSTRHFDLRIVRVAKYWGWQGLLRRGVTDDEKADIELIRRLEEDEREAAKLVDTMLGANSDGLSTHMEA